VTTRAQTTKEKTPVQARHSTRGVAAALALITAALLSACGTADTAAVVNGHTIKERDAQEAAQQINQAFHPETPLTTADAVSALITAPFILDVANRIGHPQTPSAATAAMPTITEPAESTIEMVRAQAAIQYLSETDKSAILSAMSKAHITVNPRYGRFVPSEARLTPANPDWIVAER
jgi:hypothetical protein